MKAEMRREAPDFGLDTANLSTYAAHQMPNKEYKLGGDIWTHGQMDRQKNGQMHKWTDKKWTDE